MDSWSATISGRIISKKNSKQIRFNRHTGKRFVASSDAYGRWHAAAVAQIINSRPKTPLTGPLVLDCVFTLKGKLDSDLDNMMASIADLLQDAKVIANDKEIVEATLRKEPGAKDFETRITIRQLPV